MTLHKIIEFCKDWFSLWPTLNSKIQTTIIFKSSVRENIDLNKIDRCVHDLALYKTSFDEGQQFMSYPHKIKCEF
jgi:hypothetical protein